jgi:hypothetical protein
MEKFSDEDLEMLEVSVEQRYERLVNTERDLRIEFAQGFTEECHKSSEVEWCVSAMSSC